MNKPRNTFLLFTSETAPSYAGDGRNALLFAQTLSAKGYTSALCCLNPNGLLPKQEIINGILVRRIIYRFKTNLGRLVFRDFLLHFLLREGRNYTTWIVYGAMPGHRLILVIGWLLRKPTIFRSTLFGFDDATTLIGKGNTWPVGPILEWIYSRARIYFALNSAFAREWNRFKRLRGIPTFESPQGVNLSIFSTRALPPKNVLRQRLGLPQDSTILLMVGHLIPRKGYPEIFRWLAKANGNIFVAHVGRHNAPEWDALSLRNEQMEAIKREGQQLLGNRIRFFGDSDEVSSFMQASDIFLLASEREGYPPNSLSEAMAAGMAILSRKIDGSEDFLIDSVNSLVYVDRDDFTLKLELLLLDSNLRQRVAKGARDYALSNFSIDSISSDFLNCVDSNIHRKLNVQDFTFF